MLQNTGPWTWADSLEQCKKQKMDMKFGIWNVRSLSRSFSLKTVPRELAEYKLDLVGMQEVRWDSGGTEPVDLVVHSKLFLSVVVRTL
jgi:hypothetical protein